MKACKDLCPVYNIQRCCFLCDEKECYECCSQESNENCDCLVEIPDDDCEKLAENILKELSEVTVEKEKLETREKDLKERLKALMEQTNTKKLDNNPFFKVTYIAATSTVTFDSTLFKKSCPDLYKKYSTKPKETKSYIKCEAVKKGGEQSEEAEKPEVH